MKFKVTKEDRKGLKRVFKSLHRDKTDKEVFYDLCFCICAPQTTFKNNQKVIQEFIMLGYYDTFWNTRMVDTARREVIENICKPVRFYRNKARYLIEAKKKFSEILYHINLWKAWKDKGVTYTYAMRQYLVDDVKGLGMKAASHFLRNLGDTHLAIIDTHILKFLSKELDYYDYPKTFSKRYYIELEVEFQRIAKKYRLTPAELDALIWKRYSKTEWKDFNW